MNKRSVLEFSVLCLMVFVLLSSFVSAQYYGYGGGGRYQVEKVINLIVDSAEPVLRAVLGGDFWDGYLLFEKLLLFILVAVISYLVLYNSVPIFKKQNKTLVKFIAVIIALIGIRNIDYLWLNTIFVQYQVLFIAVAGVLPFMIFWFFLKDFDSIPRKVGWIFYAAVYFGLWATNPLPAHSSVYLWAALAALVYAFFIDARVTRWLEVNAMKKGNRMTLLHHIAILSREIEEIEENLAQEHFRGHPKAEKLAREKIDKLEKRIRDLQKGL
jgi:hypothetical protein